ncbi:hypothetical protein B0H10DRAFT_2160016 [Mycena sp. CBHHK59/15]|nr:hypothetical protein B0H10DRAFT_2160016 [Mycena sp. CBHHK59/15]
MRFSLAVAALASVLSVRRRWWKGVQPPLSGTRTALTNVSSQLVFNPSNITAAVGDTVSFQFQGKNHSVTQSTFANPCGLMTTPAEGINSGFQFVAANATELPQWSFTVNNATTPLWFFCAQTNPANHCNMGMVFSVNAKEDGPKNFAAYQAAAMAGNAAGGAVGAASSAAGSVASAASGFVTSAAGAAATGAASVLSAAGGALTGAAGALTNAAAATGSASAASASGSGTPNAAGRVGTSAATLLAAVGLAAGMLL